RARAATSAMTISPGDHPFGPAALRIKYTAAKVFDIGTLLGPAATSVNVEQFGAAERITPVAAASIKASHDQDLAIEKQGSGVTSAASGEWYRSRPRFGVGIV